MQGSLDESPDKVLEVFRTHVGHFPHEGAGNDEWGRWQEQYFALQRQWVEAVLADEQMAPRFVEFAGLHDSEAASLVTAQLEKGILRACECLRPHAEQAARMTYAEQRKWVSWLDKIGGSKPPTFRNPEEFKRGEKARGVDWGSDLKLLEVIERGPWFTTGTRKRVREQLRGLTESVYPWLLMLYEKHEGAGDKELKKAMASIRYAHGHLERLLVKDRVADMWEAAYSLLGACYADDPALFPPCDGLPEGALTLARAEGERLQILFAEPGEQLRELARSAEARMGVLTAELAPVSDEQLNIGGMLGDVSFGDADFEALQAIDELRVLLDCSAELLRDKPEAVNPQDYGFPQAWLDQQIEDRVQLRKQDEDAMAALRKTCREEDIDDILRSSAEADIRAADPVGFARLDDRLRFHVLVFDFWSIGTGSRAPTLSLDDVLARVRKVMADRHQLIVKTFAEEPPWEARMDLIPQGSNDAERRQDYLETRQKLLHYHAKKRGEAEKARGGPPDEGRVIPGSIEWPEATDVPLEADRSDADVAQAGPSPSAGEGAVPVGAERTVDLQEPLISAVATGRDATPHVESGSQDIPATNTFRKVGQGWQIYYEKGPLVHIALIGGAYIAELLRQPGKPVSYAALEVAGGRRVRGTTTRDDLIPEDGDEIMPASETSTGEAVTDSEYLSQLKRDLADTVRDLAEAERHQDEAAVERLTQERDKLAGQLGKIMGLGGTVRRLGDEEAKRRGRIQKAVHRAIDRISRDNKSLARFLRKCISFQGPPTYTGDIRWTIVHD
jgi:hypothetical protein